MNNVAQMFVRNTCKSAHVKTKKAVANRIKICGSGKITRVSATRMERRGNKEKGMLGATPIKP
jgi:ribosomal protein L35